MPTQTITNQFNYTQGTVKAFGDVPATYETLINLTTNYAFNHIEVINETDADIILKFANTTTVAEWIIPPYSVRVRDWFMHNGIVQYKYDSSAPTLGVFRLDSWLGGR